MTFKVNQTNSQQILIALGLFKKTPFIKAVYFILDTNGNVLEYGMNKQVIRQKDIDTYAVLKCVEYAGLHNIHYLKILSIDHTDVINPGIKSRKYTKVTDSLATKYQISLKIKYISSSDTHESDHLDKSDNYIIDIHQLESDLSKKMSVTNKKQIKEDDVIAWWKRMISRVNADYSKILKLKSGEYIDCVELEPQVLERIQPNLIHSCLSAVSHLPKNPTEIDSSYFKTIYYIDKNTLTLNSDPDNTPTLVGTKDITQNQNQQQTNTPKNSIKHLKPKIDEYWDEDNTDLEKIINEIDF